MKIFRNVLIGSAILAAAGSAQAWWGTGPFNGIGNGYGDGDMSFNMGFSGRANAYGNGYGYNAPYYGYAPYGYAPYAGYAPYGYGVPTAPATEGGESNEQAEGTSQPYFPGYAGNPLAHQQHMMDMQEKHVKAMEAHRKAMQERMDAQRKAFEERYAMRSEVEESK